MTDDYRDALRRLMDPAVANLVVGSSRSGDETYYCIRHGIPDLDDSVCTEASIPPHIDVPTAEYRALISGLVEVRVDGFQMVEITTNSQPIIDHLQYGVVPSSNLRPLYDVTRDLLSKFSEVDICPTPLWAV